MRRNRKESSFGKAFLSKKKFMSKKIVGTLLLITMSMVLSIVLLPVAATASEVNFVPDPSSALSGETTNVSIWLDSTEGVFSFDAEIHFDPAVVNITNASVGDFPTGFGMGHYGNYVILGGVTSDFNDKPAGHWLLANLTLEAKNAGTSPLNFNPSKTYLGNQTGKRVPATWNNGTFTCAVSSAIFDTGSPANPYPSIFGTHNGTITVDQNITVDRMYTYPCQSTGGHTELVKIWNETTGDCAEAHWDGYIGDYHNISFNRTLVLKKGVIYNYTIRTGSYPQIHHTHELTTDNGTIRCTEFVDANGRLYKNWIPAIKLWE